MDIIGTISGWISSIGIGIGAFILLLVIAIVGGKSYIKAPPDKVKIISGKRKTKYVIGSAAIKLPFVDMVNELTLEPIEVEVQSDTVYSRDMIPCNVRSTFYCKIPSDSDEMLAKAAQNFLNMDTKEIANIVQNLANGAIRELSATLDLKEMITNRQRFAQIVRETAEKDYNALGLDLLLVNCSSITDSSGIVESLGVENSAKITKSAAIAKSEAIREVREETAKNEMLANQAEIKAQQEIASQANMLRIQKAQLKQESDARQAEADVAYKIQEEEQRKTLEQKTVDAEIARAEREAELQARQVEIEKERLEAEISKKADAEKYAAQQHADAELYRRQKEAEAEKAEIQAQAEAKLIQAQRDAEAEKARAEAAKFAKEQEAAAIQAVGEAEAKAIEAKGIAEAEAIQKKAEAMKQYGQAATLEMMIDILPEMAAKIAEPLSSIGEVKVIGGDGTGVSSIAGNTPILMKQVFDTIEAATGVDMGDLVRANGAEAKMNRNITVNNAASAPAAAKPPALTSVEDSSSDTEAASDEIVDDSLTDEAVEQLADAIVSNAVEDSLD